MKRRWEWNKKEEVGVDLVKLRSCGSFISYLWSAFDFVLHFTCESIAPWYLVEWIVLHWYIETFMNNLLRLSVVNMVYVQAIPDPMKCFWCILGFGVVLSPCALNLFTYLSCLTLPNHFDLAKLKTKMSCKAHSLNTIAQKQCPYFYTLPTVHLGANTELTR